MNSSHDCKPPTFNLLMQKRPIVSSFLPAATQMIYDMGLQEMLCGVTFECMAADPTQPKVVRCIFEGKSYTSAEIDQIFSAHKSSGKSIYYVEEQLLEKIAPDIIFTQDVCEVCQIDTTCTLEAVEKLSKKPVLVPLTPQNLEDVFEAALLIAKTCGEEEIGTLHVAALKQRMQHITQLLLGQLSVPKRVLLLEWMEPLYNCGHWIPYQIAAAGGVDMLSNPAGDSLQTPWDKICRYDPEVIVVAPCGLDIHRSQQEFNLLSNRKNFHQLQAVKNKQVYLAHYELFTQPSASTLVEGIELLAGLFYPEIISIPEQLKDKWKPAEW